jgi:hypothetical protein
MDVFEAIETRRSVNEPWGFLVLGPASRRAFGDVLGGRKSRKVADPVAAAAGAVMDDAATLAALGVAAGERIVAMLNLGEPATLPEARPRTPAAAKTVWLP